jgi:hypothetical protein
MRTLVIIVVILAVVALAFWLATSYTRRGPRP